MLAPTSEANTAESPPLGIWQKFLARLNRRLQAVLAAVVAIAAIAGTYAYMSRRAIEVKVSGVEASVPIRVFGLGTVEARVRF